VPLSWNIYNDASGLVNATNWNNRTDINMHPVSACMNTQFKDELELRFTGANRIYSDASYRNTPCPFQTYLLDKF
jgi:hypothetical protein